MTSILSNEELNQQIRNVSHEIRNHLSICDMYSQIIKKNLEKYEIHNSSIENAIECIQQSIKIIGTNLLELKSLNQNNPQILDFEKIVKTGAEMSKAYICDKNIEFEVYVKNTALINADETKLLVLHNKYYQKRNRSDRNKRKNLSSCRNQRR